MRVRQRVAMCKHDSRREYDSDDSQNANIAHENTSPEIGAIMLLACSPVNRIDRYKIVAVTHIALRKRCWR